MHYNKVILVLLLGGLLFSGINLWFYFQPSALELAIYSWLQFSQPSWLTPIAQGISESIWLLVWVSLIWCGWLLAKRYIVSGFLVLASILLLEFIDPLKQLFNRPRPVVGMVATDGFLGTSFPSGHSLTAVLLVGTLIITYRSVAPYKPYLVWVSVGTGYVLMVGWSRIYLGAHYPSDVLGGYVVGSLGLVILTTAYAWARMRWRRV